MIEDQQMQFRNDYASRAHVDELSTNLEYTQTQRRKKWLKIFLNPQMWIFWKAS